MSAETDSPVTPPSVIVNHGTLWAVAVPLIVIGATLNVYGQDITNWVAGLSDPLKLVVSEYLVVIARGVLMPVGAVLITASILMRAYEKASANRTP